MVGAKPLSLAEHLATFGTFLIFLFFLFLVGAKPLLLAEHLTTIISNPSLGFEPTQRRSIEQCEMVFPTEPSCSEVLQSKCAFYMKRKQ